MKKSLFLFLLCILSSAAASAQVSRSISGQVLDSLEKKPFDGAFISLLLSADSSLVKTTITEPNGHFDFQDLDTGSYFLLITAEGFPNQLEPAIRIDDEHPAVLLPAIELKPAGAVSLEEFAVTAKIPMIERRIDRTVVNVDAMLTAVGNSLFELIGKSPGVIVNQDGSILLKGKSGVQIYMDDKPTYLSGDALVNYLKSIPASAISQIEIMTTPPAKYDAAGSIGIINVITKKSKLKGFNGNVSTTYGQGRYAKNHNNFTFNYRNYKVNVFGTLSGGTSESYNTLVINRIYKNEDLSTASTFDQTIMGHHYEDYGFVKLGADYYVTDKSTLGISMNGMYAKSASNSRNISELGDASGAPTGTVIADNKSGNTFKNGDVNINFRHKYDSTGKQLTMDLDYVRYGTYGNSGYLYNTYNPAGSLLLTERLDGTLPAEISIYAFKTDYTRPFKADAKLEAGFKTSYTYIDNKVDFFNTVGGLTTADYDKSNHFKYDEMINAAYINFSKQFTRFGFQTGLRAEGTTSRGNQLGNAEKPSSRFKRDYLNLFPTVYLSYKLDSTGDNQLILSYGRRINRPYYQDMNPFISPLDKFTYYTGNPLLKPMFSHDITFTYSFKSYFSTSLSYVRTRNEINETIEINSDKLYYSRPGNIGQSQNINLNVSSTIPVGKWLTTTIYSEVANLQYKSQLYTETLNSQGNYFYVNLMNSFVFGKGWTAELSGYYITRLTSAQFTLKQRGALNLAVQKKILKDKGSLKLSANDILYTQINNGIINNLHLTYADYSNRYESRTVYFTFTYSFGKPFVTEPKHEGSGSDSEQQRVKN